MPTPYTKVQDKFHSKFQSKTVLDPTLEEEFFNTAIGYFSLDLYELTYDDTTKEIAENLTQSEINLLGLLMYKAYIERDRDRISKLYGMAGKDVKLTNLGDSKRSIEKLCEDNNIEIEKIIHKMKDNSYF